MRIFYSFLIVFTSAILILLPVTAGIYDFRTDQRTDDFTVITAPGTTNSTIQLFDSLYSNDTSTISLLSHNTGDAPIMSSYNTTTRAVVIIGLDDNVTRIIEVSYDVDAIPGSGALNTFLGYLPWIWIIIWVALPIAGLAAIWLGRA